MASFLVILGKFIVFVSRLFNLGHGSTWPGHVAISINKNFIREVLKENPQLKIILIAGTNGKTTTGKLIQTILERANYRVFQNESGANLLNGIASSVLLHSNILCKINYDYAIFEVDENTLPLALKEITPDYLILLNLFRDQLDRYGEVNTIVSKWRGAIQHLLPKTKLILNADDPQIAFMGLNSNVIPAKAGIQKNDWMSDRVGHDKNSRTIIYFGLEDKKLAISKHQHAVDSTYCPKCGSKLLYSSIFYSHLGIWKCPKCTNIRPQVDAKDASIYPLVGIYNRYNTIAAVSLSRQLGVVDKVINSALREFKPAFGRQEILNVDGKKVQIFLSKNPTSFNESLRTIADLNAKNVLFVLNDRIPDGRDVSWIWDVDFEEIAELRRMKIFVSGDRVFDIALRLKYADLLLSETQINADLKNAINTALKATPKNETLYILPTYSAMLETRKILTGRKIL